MMASEMDMDEDEQEVMAIVASDLNMKIGAKVNYIFVFFSWRQIPMSS